LKNFLKFLINYFLNLTGTRLISKEFYNLSVLNKELVQSLEVIPVIKKLESVNKYINFLGKSQSQRGRVPMDLFVLQYLDFKSDGFFIEFGAGNGKYLSNTYLMEKDFNWSGILCEPVKGFMSDIEKNRSCIIENICVWSKTGESLEFIETDVPEHSTINKFSMLDKIAPLRKKGKKYQVKTITLNDLLDKHGAPELIDYLSIDTEGSELEILEAFNFKKYRIKFITCEHMFTENREKIYNLLISKGYKRIFENLSKQDDWYVID
jgi:FkbM family methyltransferase